MCGCNLKAPVSLVVNENIQRNIIIDVYKCVLFRVRSTQNNIDCMTNECFLVVKFQIKVQTSPSMIELFCGTSLQSV